MNIAAVGTMGAAGMAAGWFVPLAAARIAEYKLNKYGKILPFDTRFSTPLLRLICLVVCGMLLAAVGVFTENLLHAVLLAVILLDATVIAIIDIRIHLIPNEAVLVMVMAGLILQIGFFGLSAMVIALISAVIIMVVFIALGLLLGLETIGAGDVKLAGALGIALGWPLLMYGMVAMSAILIIWCAIGLITNKLNLKSKLAFAPFMMAGTVIAIIAGMVVF